MSIRIKLMSWNIQKGKTQPPFIARVMRDYGIDICALLEVPKSKQDALRTAIIAELNSLAWYQYTWRSAGVNVGDESVVYIWHEAAAPAPNAFKSCKYMNNEANTIKGPVLKNTAGERIFFPETKTTWASLPGKPDGRRPAYCTFETNDGSPVRRFTFLDIHTPFAEKENTRIQSYATHLYASSREIRTVETLDTAHVCTQAKAAAIAHMATIVDPLIPAGNATAQEVRTAAVNAASEKIIGQLDIGASLKEALTEGTKAGVQAAVNKIELPPPFQMSTELGTRLARAAAAAGAMAAVYLVASISPATAPAGATTNVAAAATLAGNSSNATAMIFEFKATKKTTSAFRSAIKAAANDVASTAIAVFAHAELPTAVVDCAIMAGDFNVAFPDQTGYQTAHKTKMDGNNNAYVALLTASAPNTATNTAKSTRIGPTAFRGQRIYILKTPNPIQNTAPTAANYVPLDVNSLVGKRFMGYAAWIQGLKNLATTQKVAWAPLLKAPIAGRITEAFDSTTRINDTNFYRANVYDNIFVRGAEGIPNAGVIDVMSELGSWPAHTVADPLPTTFAPNPWPAARNRLNPTASAQLSVPGYQLSYGGYTITPALNDAEQVAVFFDQYISDHLPVFVEVQI